MDEQGPTNQEVVKNEEQLEGLALLKRIEDLRTAALSYQRTILGKKAGGYFMEVIAEKSNSIIENYKAKNEDAKKWLAWHGLIGSGPTTDDIDKFKLSDFPGEDSVVTFLESLGDPAKIKKTSE